MPLYDTLIKETTNGSGGIGNNRPLFYWLGSRSAYVNNNGANFFVCTVDSGVGSNWNLVIADPNADGSLGESEKAFGVRPVVTLNSNIQIEEATAIEGVTTWTIK